MTDFSRVMSLATVKVDNCFPTIEGLWTYLNTLNLLDEERLRPGWDTYFMVRLSSYAGLMIDARISSITQVKLYEAPSWGFTSEVEKDLIDWI